MPKAPSKVLLTRSEVYAWLGEYGISKEEAAAMIDAKTIRKVPAWKLWQKKPLSEKQANKKKNKYSTSQIQRDVIDKLDALT